MQAARALSTCGSLSCIQTQSVGVRPGDAITDAIGRGCLVSSIAARSLLASAVTAGEDAWHVETRIALIGTTSGPNLFSLSPHHFVCLLAGVSIPHMDEASRASESNMYFAMIDKNVVIFGGAAVACCLAMLSAHIHKLDGSERLTG